MLKKNVGTIDKVLRAILGVGLLTLAFTGQTPWGYIGIVPLATALLGTCPAYSIFGISTCGTKQ